MRYIVNYNLKENKEKEFQKFIKENKKPLRTTLRRDGNSWAYIFMFWGLGHVMLPISGSVSTTPTLMPSALAMIRRG